MATRRGQVKAPETVGQLRRRLPDWTVTYHTELCFQRRLPRARPRRFLMHVVRAVPHGYEGKHFWRGVPYVEARSRIKRAACAAVLKGARDMEMEEGV